MIQLLGRLVLASSMLLVVACEDSKDSDNGAKALGKAQGFTGAPGVPGPSAKTKATDKTATPPEAGKTPGLGSLGATPPLPSAGNPAAATDELAKQAADLANQAGKQATGAAGTLGTVPGMPAASASKKPVTTTAALARLRGLEAKACACTTKGCANLSLGVFGQLYEDIKHMPANKTVYAEVKQRSETITRCLLKNGITGQQVMGMLTGSGAGAAGPAGATGSPASATALASKLEAMATDACKCKNKPCATRSLGTFAAYFAMNKNVQAGQAELTRIKNASAKLSRCLIRNGIAPETLTAIFQ